MKIIMLLLFALFNATGCENQKNLSQISKNNIKDIMGDVHYVSFDIHTIVGIHKYQIDNNQYGNINCKISKFSFNELLIDSNNVEFNTYDVRMKVDFGNQIYWLGYDYSKTNYEYLAVSLENSDMVWSIKTSELFNVLDCG